MAAERAARQGAGVARRLLHASFRRWAMAVPALQNMADAELLDAFAALRRDNAMLRQRLQVSAYIPKRLSRLMI